MTQGISTRGLSRKTEYSFAGGALIVNKNTFHWASRVSRQDIRRLYESDARGLLDEELLDKIHFAFYARVCDMFEVREAQQTGRVKCRNCGAPVPQLYKMGSRNKNNILKCEQCHWEVTCSEYYESYTGKNLLPGSVADLFESYLERFQKAKTVPQKMLLIDWLIHQFHVMQGVPNKSVGKNVISGTEEQLCELLETLANGPASTPGLVSVDDWQAVYYDPVRLFKQSHSHKQVQAIAARLEIKGRGQMSEDELIPEILRLAPELAAKPAKNTDKENVL
jgi:ribosomal protein L37AE/L43A